MVRLVEHEEYKRRELVQSILSYVQLASFLTYRDNDGSVSYAIWFGDKYLNYVLGLHAARPNLGGVEITPSHTPSILQECGTVWEMEMRGYGAAELPQDTGIRSATAALGTQITDVSYRLLICQRVERSDIIQEYARSGGRPTSIYRKVAGVAAREAWEFLGPSDTKHMAAKPITPKAPPYNNTRIILGANNKEHLKILQDSFPAGSLKVSRHIAYGMVAEMATMPPKSGTIHSPTFTDEELAQLELIPTKVTEVPMKYGRAITSTTQAPIPFPDVLRHTQYTWRPTRQALYADEHTHNVYDVPCDISQSVFPINIIHDMPQFPVAMIKNSE